MLKDEEGINGSAEGGAAEAGLLERRLQQGRSPGQQQGPLGRAKEEK